MSYAHSTREDRRPSRFDGGRSATPPRIGALTYLTFALSVGFTVALVFGLVG